MQYNYEALNDETFQKLASAIIALHSPDAQCLPVGQPDGGRDAFLNSDKDGEDLTVYQVKFSRNPDSKDARQALIDLIKSELEKVQKLKAKGLKKYYLITNIKGTSHLEHGSIDKANKVLSEGLGVKSFVWWRDDLDARLSSNGSLKWSFPDILRATDFLETILSFDPARDEYKRIERTIRSYVSAQYDSEQEVKFKQVDLKKQLLDLFVDVPLGMKYPWDAKQRSENYVFRHYELKAIEQQDRLRAQPNRSARYRSLADETVEAAKFMIELPLDQRSYRFVIEGAPGQGKSTVTQYICQANRLRLLGKLRNDTLPVDLVNSPLRLPFRVDLRDFASWISGRHPYAQNTSDSKQQTSGTSLETFLAMQITWFSGGQEFKVNDLAALLERSHILIVLDGFDEVAETKTRSKLVEEISMATSRFEALALSCAVIVTSRPAAFTTLPGFSEGEWFHLELKDLRQEHIKSYATKWMQARGLSQEEKDTVSLTLKHKLEQPHLRDLSRNPMQLAILLLLIHTRGPSLPDKRTELYRQYMDVFLNREAEKTDIVRDHRDLLVAIHGYLGWVLQKEAEVQSGSGSIEESRLKALLKSYLEFEGHSPDLVDELFSGMVERVVALVSRVAGTYEFEIQPLREYFTAQYLFETCPYSPSWDHQPGTRPDRFNALARNSYWTNVTRFFCGFYSKGELPALVDGLAQLFEDPNFSRTTYPSSLALMLLSDHVFSQSPRCVKQVVDKVAALPDFMIYLSDFQNVYGIETPSLPKDSGQDELVVHCLRLFENELPMDLRRSLSGIVSHNWPREKSTKALVSRVQSSSSTTICVELEELGILGNITESDAEVLFQDNLRSYVIWAMQGSQSDFLDSNIEMRDTAIDVLLDGPKFGPRSFFLRFDDEQLSVLNILGVLSIPQLFSFFGRENVDSEIALYCLPFPRLILRRISDGPKYESLKNYCETNIPKVLNLFTETLNEPVGNWRTSSDPWTKIVNALFEVQTPNEVATRFALISTGIKSRECRGRWSNEGFSASLGLVERLRHARLKSGDFDWWCDKLDHCDADELLVALPICLFWATEKCLKDMNCILLKLLSQLNARDWDLLCTRFELMVETVGITESSLPAAHLIEIDPTMNHWLWYFLTARVTSPARNRDIHSFVESCNTADTHVLKRAHSLLNLSKINASDYWKEEVRISKLLRDTKGFHPWPHTRRRNMPLVVALDVLDEPDQHATYLLEASAKRKLSSSLAKAKKVSKVAKNEKWFENDV